MQTHDDILETLSTIADLRRRPIYIWGAGGIARKTYLAAQGVGATVTGFIDGTDACVGQQVFTLPIHSADHLDAVRSNHPLILIASTWWREIGVELINRSFVPNQDFVSVQRRHSTLPWNIDLGDTAPVYIGRRTTQPEELLHYYPSVRIHSIGAFCSIALGARIAANHPLNTISTNLFVTHRARGIVPVDRLDLIEACNPPVRIGNDVWIGRNVTIMPGVCVGHGSVLAANATITKDVPPYAIVGGSPAKVIRYRFEPSEIDLLLTVKWWTWSDRTLRQHATAFQEPQRFFELARRLVESA